MTSSFIYTFLLLLALDCANSNPPFYRSYSPGMTSFYRRRSCGSRCGSDRFTVNVNVNTGHNVPYRLSGSRGYMRSGRFGMGFPGYTYRRQYSAMPRGSIGMRGWSAYNDRPDFTRGMSMLGWNPSPIGRSIMSRGAYGLDDGSRFGRTGMMWTGGRYPGLMRGRRMGRGYMCMGGFSRGCQSYGARMGGMWGSSGGGWASGGGGGGWGGRGGWGGGGGWGGAGGGGWGGAWGWGGGGGWGGAGGGGWGGGGGGGGGRRRGYYDNDDD